MKQILFNSKIYIEKGHFQEAILIKDGIIEAIGSNEEIRSLADKDTVIIDCHGLTMIPGLNDSHLHLMQFAEASSQAQIENCKSIDEIILICREFIAQHPDKVINGLHSSGWNQDLFTDDKRIPDCHDLDKISTEIPVVLERVCGHIVSANSKAIEMLGTDRHPDGIFTGESTFHIRSVIPDFTYDECRELIIKAMKYAVSCGLTSLQSNDVGSMPLSLEDSYKLFHDIYESGEGLLRYRHQSTFDSIDEFRHHLTSGEYAKGTYPETSWLTLGPLKLFKDGSLGARTALLKNSYPGSDAHGLEWLSDKEMDAYCKLASANGVQVITHAIGDAAIQSCIDCYKKSSPKLRNAVVHCQITDQSMVDEINSNKILVMAQPIFIDYDKSIVNDLCGKELASSSYAFDAYKGNLLSYGTDSPVEDLNPFPNIYAAVTRCGMDGESFYPEHAVDVDAAIDAYTYGSAYAEFAENKKGRLKPGYYADLVLLDKDIFTIPHDQIKTIKPFLTMVGGKIVFSI